MTDKVSKKKIVSFHFGPVVFSVLDFLTFEAGADTLSQNVGNDLPLFYQYAVTK
jgi:hypothetical protein